MQSTTDDAYQSVFGTQAPIAVAPGPLRVERAMQSARAWLLARQQPGGWWRGRLEGDTTLESYLVLLYTFLGRSAEPEIALKLARLAARLRARSLPGGGWSAYPGGPADLSVSCLSYFALKLAGDSPDAPHMHSGRAEILALGGAARANSYTRYHLALFGQVSWDHVPAIPPEIIFLPAAGPFSIYDMSSWSRTIFVPLSIIYARKPIWWLPVARGVRELFLDHEAAARAGAHGHAAVGGWRRFFEVTDRALKLGERLPFAPALRRAAVRRAGAWMTERLRDSDGLGAILPAMTSAVIALRCLGHGDDSPLLRAGVAELEKLFIDDVESGWSCVQPCLSPVWDTCLAASALIQSSAGPDGDGAGGADHGDGSDGDGALTRAATWLLDRQCRRPGDWTLRNHAAPGGWAFEFANAFYPDVDDTAMALIVLRNARAAQPTRTAEAIRRGLGWMLGMQNRDGGWASFDRDNHKQWLTQVPFADHNAMIDPSTADITGRVLESLSHCDGFDVHHPVVQRALRFLRADQCADGSWFGRWGVNYIYGTWQVLRGLKCIGEEMDKGYVRRAARWLTVHQNPDGGWGESIASYDDPTVKGIGPSTPSQTAWAVMGLCAAYQFGSPAVRAGVQYLLRHQREDGGWPPEERWTGTGFPRVFYLNYEYYRHYFPLTALAQYRASQVPRPAPHRI